jgi:predicted nuclease of predicted toxin-antitoxin system
MSTPIRFHLDESMPTGVAYGLRKRDRDCTISKEVSLVSATDQEQLAYATLDKRVLISRDQDFLVLASQSNDHAGIIHWRQKTHFGQLVKDIDALTIDKAAEDLAGQVYFL